MSKPRLLGDDFEVWGHWWLPGQQEAALTGKLSSRYGRLELLLLGSFPSLDINNFGLVVPIIHGAASAKEITILDAVQVQFSLKAPGTEEQRFQNMSAIFGGHLEEADTKRITGFVIYADNIGPWSGISGVEGSMTLNGNSIVGMEYKLSALKNQKFTVENAGALITVGPGIRTRNEEYLSYGFDTSPSIDVRFDEYKNYEEILRFGAILTNLLSLFVGAELMIGRLGLRFGLGDESRVFDVHLDYPPPENTKILDGREVLVPLQELGASCVHVFERWISEEPRIRDSIDIQIGTMRRRKLPVHVELTSLCQSLEAFHRNTVCGGYVAKKAFNPILAGVMQAVPLDIHAGLRKSIEDRLRYAYEFTLKTRLQQLLGGLSDDTHAQLGIDTEGFSQAVVKARNDYTHWDESNGRKDDGADLKNLVAKLNVISRIVLLKHVGVDESLVVSRIVNNSHRYLPRWYNFKKPG